MTDRRPQIMLVLLLLGALCLALNPVFSFMAGCSADMKGGSLGDISLGQRYANLAVAAMFVGMVLGSFGILAGPANPKRATRAAAWFFFGGLASWVVAFNAEGWGVRSCL